MAGKSLLPQEVLAGGRGPWSESKSLLDTMTREDRPARSASTFPACVGSSQELGMS